MFLTNKEYDIEDFLKATEFIAPKGTTIAYFITPQEINLPNGSNFQQQKIDTPEDESITYMRQEPVQKQDQAQTPADYSVWNTPDLGRRQPTPNILPPVTEPDDLDSPFIKVLSEGKMFGTDIKLLEDYKFWPKSTIFHCVPVRITESNPDFENIYKRSEFK